MVIGGNQCGNRRGGTAVVHCLYNYLYRAGHHPAAKAHLLAGPVVRRLVTGIESRFPRSSRACDLKCCTVVASLPGAGRYKVSAGMLARPVSGLRLGETSSVICNLYVSAASRALVEADPSLRIYQHAAETLHSKQMQKQQLNLTKSRG